MKVKQLFFALLFYALGLSSLQAQNDETLRLSLSESQQYAVQHNYSLQNASLDVQKAEAAKWQTLSSMLPQVSSSFDYSNMLGYEMSMGGFRIPLNPYGTFAVTASIALSASQIMGTLMNDISVKMSDINQRQSELTTRTGVKSVYTSILVMEEVVSLLDSTLGNMLTLQEATRKSVQAGAVESIELDKLSVQVATLRNSITSNRRALKMLYSSLILQLGADGNTQLVLTTPLEQVMNVDEAARLTMGGFNMQDNNNYQLLEENEKLSQMQVTNAWLQFTPTVTAFYQYNAKTYFGREEGMNMTPPQMVGASINLPIFQSGSRLAAIRQAKISQQENANTKQQTEDALQVQFNQDCYNLISAIESYQIQKENLPVTKRVLDNISNKYRIGYASNLEVTNASTDFITAQSNYVQAVMEVVTAQIALENLLGKDK
jgi:outer membrane protein TolC